MKTIVTALAAAVTTLLTASAADLKLVDCPPPPPGFPRFQFQEIASDFKIGYAVHVADVNGDGKPDIVVVDKERVVWYENPSWKCRAILTGKTKPDNVCICSLDIDGDQKIDFVLGAGRRGTDTKTPGTLQWLRRGKTLDDEWDMFPIPCDEPTVHRVKTRTTLYGGIGEFGFVMVPLMGRDATQEKNWTDGRPVNVIEYERSNNPIDPKSWKQTVINNQLHVIHNFELGFRGCFREDPDFFASFEGITASRLYPNPKYGLKSELIHAGNQTNLNKSRGSSEIAIYDTHLASIEPWHGNQIVYYRTEDKQNDLLLNVPKVLKRIVVDEKLRWGHAIQISYLDNYSREKSTALVPFIIGGVRDNPDPKQGDKFTEKHGVRLYRATDAKGEKWERYILEDGGVAVEDLAVADLDGDGKPEIIAVGRQTQNCRIYWNKGK